MEKSEDHRIQLIEQLVSENRKTAIAHTQYIACNREYAPGESLYMREVHFIVAVGLGDGKTMSELADTLEVTAGAVSQLAARMEKKGYVVRMKAAEDKRQTIARLTEKGIALYKEHTEYDRENYRKISEILREFSDEELKKILHYEQILQLCFTKYAQDPNA